MEVEPHAIRAAAGRARRPTSTRVEQLLGEADRLRDESRRRLEDELEQLEKVLLLTRAAMRSAT